MNPERPGKTMKRLDEPGKWLRKPRSGARAAASLVFVFTFAVILVGIARAASPPVNTGNPTITGTAEVGSTLSAIQGSWNGDPAPGYTYQWQRCEAVVSPVVTTPFNSGPSLSNPRGIAVDSAGNVYTANSGANTVSKFLPDGSLAGGAWPVTVGAGPEAVTVDSAGNVYTANYVGDSVSKILPDGSLAGGAWPVTVGDGPLGITIDSAGNVYTANVVGDNVSKVLPDGSLAGGVWPVTVGDGPYDIAIDSASNLYTPNSNANNVVKITSAGVQISTLALPQGSSFQNAVPLGVATDSAGNIYTANSGSGYVSKILPGFTLAPAPWPASLGSSSMPGSIASDSAGHVYVAQKGNDRVRKIATSDGQYFTLASSSNGISVPWDIATDSLGNVYVVNDATGRVPKITQVPCTDITGATASSYPLVGADEGKKVRVIVTANNGIGTAVIAATAPTATVGPDTRSAPANTVAPTISGTAEVGGALTANKGTWTGHPTPSYAYQWQRCDTGGNDCADISGAAASTYTPTSADEGKTLRVKVTATNSQGPVEAVSVAVGPVPVGPGSMTTPVIPWSPPSLDVQLLPNRRSLRAGQAMTLGVRTSNGASVSTAMARMRGQMAIATAEGVRTCVGLPANLVLTRRPSGSVRSGRTVCWSSGDIPAGQQRTAVLGVRAVAVRAVSRTISASARSTAGSQASARATAKAGVRITPRAPRPVVTG